MTGQVSGLRRGLLVGCGPALCSARHRKQTAAHAGGAAAGGPTVRCGALIVMTVTLLKTWWVMVWQCVSSICDNHHQHPTPSCAILRKSVNISSVCRRRLLACICDNRVVILDLASRAYRELPRQVQHRRITFGTIMPWSTAVYRPRFALPCAQCALQKCPPCQHLSGCSTAQMTLM